jgi:hypothetical protein
VPAGIARPLVESLRNTVVCQEHDIAEFVPDPPEGLLGFDEAVTLAIARVHSSAVTTRWSGASTPGAPSDPLPTDPDWAGGSLYVDDRTRPTTADPDALWQVVEGIGGDTGWYSFPLAWRVRGWLDRAVGGVGLRRGRRDPAKLYVGDALDFWRVEELDRGRLLRLRAEMRLPGLAWLEFHVEHDPASGGGAVLRQRATFAPHGLAGHLYWWSVAAFHGIVFGGMVRGIARAAERR